MEFKTFDLGLINYKDAWEFQKKIFLEVKNAQLSSALIFCRHYPVITLGRRAKRENILASEQELLKKGIDILEVERGGDVTYHGPGQFTIYPIFNLSLLRKDIHWFLRELEEITVDLLSDLGIYAQRKFGFTGVWAGGKKIASIGITVKNWITFHGLSINIKQDDLANFNLIRPCGMDIQMTCVDDFNISSELTPETVIRLIQKRYFLPAGRQGLIQNRYY